VAPQVLIFNFALHELQLCFRVDTMKTFVMVLFLFVFKLFLMILFLLPCSVKGSKNRVRNKIKC
jgi:hypothetical protein